MGLCPVRHVHLAWGNRVAPIAPHAAAYCYWGYAAALAQRARLGVAPCGRGAFAPVPLKIAKSGRPTLSLATDLRTMVAYAPSASLWDTRLLTPRVASFRASHAHPRWGRDTILVGPPSPGKGTGKGLAAQWQVFRIVGVRAGQGWRASVAVEGLVLCTLL